MKGDAGPLADFKAPSLADIERLAEVAFASLPEVFRDMCGAVVFRIEDFPSDDVLREMECESAFDLLGLFTGIGMAQASAMAETGQLPNTIHLYRRPLLDYWAEHDETLGHLVSHVLIHEIGHHFGLSDDDIDAIEAATD